ncbi:DoxX family protein [Paracoccus sp. Z118]|uniref:DoxX family protein n=1 Tax=Paracoccus sp. Z118 TaxID=2851017 RepID=UPI001C2B855F|nr:DoxX family protein [Paracoccus sp. Z118]MBV0891622.1 DoxX family protein [Paracoccus sp. Z118]
MTTTNWTTTTWTATWAPRMLSVLRIMAGLLFMAHGTQKLFGFPDVADAAGGSLPPLMLLGGIIELVGGALIALGFFTRIAAFVASGMMAAAYFMAHAPQSFWPNLNGGDAAILYCFVFLYFVVAGPGEWGVDAQRETRA